MTKENIKSVSVTTRITEEEYNKMLEVAEKLDRNKSWVLRKALQEYLDKN